MATLRKKMAPEREKIALEPKKIAPERKKLALERKIAPLAGVHKLPNRTTQFVESRQRVVFIVIRRACKSQFLCKFACEKRVR
jgi:hypothetical protein